MYLFSNTSGSGSVTYLVHQVLARTHDVFDVILAVFPIVQVNPHFTIAGSF